MAHQNRLWAEFDFYKLLGVDRNASDEDIRAAHNQKIKELHPDRNRGRSKENYAEFTRITAAVNAARDVLLDPRRRREYDEFRMAIDQREREDHREQERLQREQRREYERQRAQQEQERREHERQQRQQREFERQQQRERAREEQQLRAQQEREQRDYELRQREREAEYNRQPTSTVTARTATQYTRRSQPASSITPSSAATIGYVILALLALAAAGALIFGFIQALPAIINFLKQLLIWTVSIAILFGVIAAAAAGMGSNSRN